MATKSKSPKNDEHAQEYLDTLSKVGQELFSDFLSDNSRNRQNYLLVSSVVTILLAFTLITPDQTDLGGIIFKFLSPDVPLLLSGLICLYFLLVYSICVLQDWEVYKFKTLPGFRAIRKKLVQSLDAITRRQHVNAHDDIDNSKAIRDIWNKYSKKIRQLDLKIKKLIADNKSLENSAFSANPSSIKKIEANKRKIKEFQEEKNLEKLKYEKIISPLRESNTKNMGVAQTVKEGSELIRSVNNKYRVYNFIIVVLEIAFPVLLALFALYVSTEKLLN